MNRLEDDRHTYGTASASDSQDLSPTLMEWEINETGEARTFTFRLPPYHKLTAKIEKGHNPFESTGSLLRGYQAKETEGWRNGEEFGDKRTFSGTGEYAIIKLQGMIFEKKKERDELQKQNELANAQISELANRLKRKEGEVMKAKANKLALIPFALSTMICSLVLLLSLTLHFVWRLTGTNIIRPETSYLLALVSFGLLATSITGLIYRGKHGIGTD